MIYDQTQRAHIVPSLGQVFDLPGIVIKSVHKVIREWDHFKAKNIGL